MIAGRIQGTGCVATPSFAAGGSETRGLSCVGCDTPLGDLDTPVADSVCSGPGTLGEDAGSRVVVVGDKSCPVLPTVGDAAGLPRCRFAAAIMAAVGRSCMGNEISGPGVMFAASR